MNVSASRYPRELKEEARRLAELGLPRVQIAGKLNVPFATLSNWVMGINSGQQKRPPEIRREAERMIRSGLSKATVARMLNVPIGTLAKWNIPSTNPPIRYPTRMRKTAIMMAKQGIMRTDIARMLKVSEKTAYLWTGGVGSIRRHYSGRYFLTVLDLLNKGYYEPEKKDKYLFNVLRRYVPGLQKICREDKIVWEVKK